MSESASRSYKSCLSCGVLIDSRSKYCAYCGTEQTLVENAVEIDISKVEKGICPNCREKIDREETKFCPACGYEVAKGVVVKAVASGNATPVIEVHAGAGPAVTAQVNPVQAVPAAPAAVQRVVAPAAASANACCPKKTDHIVAGVLALLLGSIGAQFFYMGKIGAGILCIIFCWTGIPALIGFIQGLIFLTCTEEDFQTKYACA
nr:zinc-ribbon domain-containing protein [Candidatus Sigynarchaeota archaeon]